MRKLNTSNKFDITDNVVVITGGAGLLGKNHAIAIAEIGGIPIIFDKDIKKAKEVSSFIIKKYDIKSLSFKVDVTNEKQVRKASYYIRDYFGKIDVLINNAANNPSVSKNKKIRSQKLENFTLANWNQDINVGLTSAFICSKVIGPIMVKKKKGVIINISSDLGIIAPDQRLYRSSQSLDVKPISYSVIKHGMIGLTKYISTYWSEFGIRSNTLCPGGIINDQPKDFIQKIKKLIPLNRMANQDEYISAIQFLASDASSYMNGSSLIIDGGRSVW